MGMAPGAPSYTTRLAPLNSSHARSCTAHTIAHRPTLHILFILETQLARPIWTATRQTCDTDCYRIRHILLEIYLFLFESAREKSSKL
jgi:hypothetical protein